MEEYKTAGKRIRIKRKFKRCGDFTYFDITENKDKRISKDELAILGTELPVRCRKFMREIAKKPRPMTGEETKDMLLLLSLSIGPWNGGPHGKFPTIHINEYKSVFYMKMVKALTFEKKSGWDPEKSKWPWFVKWVRLWTCVEIAKTLSSEIAYQQAFVNEKDIADTSENE